MSEKVQVTYHGQPNNSKVNEAGGKIFVDGQPVECDSNDDAALIAMASSNAHFTVGEPPPPELTKSSRHHDNKERGA
jgi:hypothetical protein